MKTRLILVSIAGVAAYVVLANFNSKIIKESSLPKDNPPAISHSQTMTTAVPAPPSGVLAEPRKKAPVVQKPTPQQELEAQTAVVVPKKEQPSAPTDVRVQPVDNTAEIKKLEQEVVTKEQQISQLLDAQEAIKVKYEEMLTKVAVKAEDSEDLKTQLTEKAKNIESLITDNKRLNDELSATQTAMGELNKTLDEFKTAAAAAKKTLEEKVALLGQSEQEKSEQEAQVEALKAQIATLQQSGQQTEEKMQALSQENTALSAKLAEMLKQHKQSEDELKAELEAATARQQEAD
ncbi:MAG: hypothetical protein AB7U29_20110, partial [Desulfobulbus sp.]